MSTDQVRVRALITLLTEAEGGRSRPIVGGAGSYRPNHNFFAPNSREMCMGFIDLPPGRNLRLGQPTELEVTFVAWPEVRAHIQEGRTWIIQEGAKVVGEGKILALLTP